MRAVALVVIVMTAACAGRADGPPPIVVDRTACSHCGMLISEVRYAAAYRAPGGATRVFDDIGCLREASKKESARDWLLLWFHDASDGRWIDGGDAVLVSSPEIHSPMGGGMIAYRDRAAAANAAQRLRGRIVTIAELTAKESGS